MKIPLSRALFTWLGINLAVSSNALALSGIEVDFWLLKA